MRHTNLSDPPFAVDAGDPARYHAGMYRMGAQLGAEQTGASLYELAPGTALCP
jgi:hypothetical protein